MECGLGACQRGIAACSDGAPTVCDAFQGLKPEVCDAIDNDCDGQTEDGLGAFTCVKENGPVKVPACVGGAPATCYSEVPGADGLDGADAGDGDGGGQDGTAGTVIAVPTGSGGCNEQPRPSRVGWGLGLQALCSAAAALGGLRRVRGGWG